MSSDKPGSARSAPPLRLLYMAAARGRLDKFLAEHSHFISEDVVIELDADRAHALNVGDLDAAVLAASASAEVLERLGLRFEALSMRVELLSVQIDIAGTAEDYQRLRDDLLTLGAHALRRRWTDPLHRCWLLAAECAWLASLASRPPDRQLLLLALLDLADVAETMASGPLPASDDDQLARLAVLVTNMFRATQAERWPESQVLRLQTTMQRTIRAAERIIPSSINSHRLVDDADRADLMRHLMQAITLYGDT